MRQPGYYSPGVGRHSDVGDNGFNLKVRSFLNKGGGGKSCLLCRHLWSECGR